MLRETGKDPGELRRQVTSPNGTTMAAIATLEEGNGSQLFLQAVQRATQRASEMGQHIEESVEAMRSLEAVKMMDEAVIERKMT